MRVTQSLIHERPGMRRFITHDEAQADHRQSYLAAVVPASPAPLAPETHLRIRGPKAATRPPKLLGKRFRHFKCRLRKRDRTDCSPAARLVSATPPTMCPCVMGRISTAAIALFGMNGQAWRVDQRIGATRTRANAGSGEGSLQASVLGPAMKSP